MLRPTAACVRNCCVNVWPRLPSQTFGLVHTFCLYALVLLTMPVLCVVFKSVVDLADCDCCGWVQVLAVYPHPAACPRHGCLQALLRASPACGSLRCRLRLVQVLAVDLHPAARLGHGILLDHGTGVVIGETAVIGNNVSLLQVGRAALP